MSIKIKPPVGWEKCRTGIKGARKWRNLRTGCWVTERGRESILHAGIHNTPVKYRRSEYTAQSAIDHIDGMTIDYEEKTGVVVDFSQRSSPASGAEGKK